MKKEDTCYDKTLETHEDIMSSTLTSKEYNILINPQTGKAYICHNQVNNCVTKNKKRNKVG